MVRSCLLLSMFVSACAASNGGTTADRHPNEHSAGPEAGLGGASGAGAGDGGLLGFGGEIAVAEAGDPSAGCVASSAGEATLEPVRLSFAFDVSGSMGKLDYPWHDPKLKWEPVVAATKAFFEDPQSSGIAASLTFFPIDADEGERCDADSYDAPDVPFTALPSGAFSDAIDRVTPKSSGDWIGGTPTLAVIQGTIAVMQDDLRANPRGRHALVLVSDGYPQGCDDDAIESVADAVKAVRDTIPTYVIGVKNPEGGPDTVTNLGLIAEAGGTEKAFIVETGDPEKSKDSLLEAVRGIRRAAISCAFELPPPPPGKVFDPGRANVTYTSDGVSSDLAYDATCATDDAWRFDDADVPTRMELCEATCGVVQADPHAVLRVEYGCARRDVVR